MRAATLAAVLLAASVQAQPVTLRYHWTKGEVVEYRFTLQTSSSVSGIPGRDDSSTQQNVTQRIRLTVDDVSADGVASMHEMVTQIRSEMQTPTGKVTYDTTEPGKASDDPVAGTMAKMFGAIIGEPIAIALGPDGSVRKVEGGSRLIDRIGESIKADRNAVMMSQALRSLYSDEALRSMLQQTFSRLPDGPVKAGDTWNGQLALGNETIGRIAAALTFTLKGLDGAGPSQRAVIGTAMKLTQEVRPPAAGGARLSLTLGDSHGEGEIRFDVARGRILRSTMKTEMPSTVNMTAPDGSPVTFRNRVTTSAAVELIEK